MNVSFNKAAIVAAVTLAALVLTNAALAATPGYPKNRPYFGSHWNQSPARSYNYFYAPSYSAPAEQSRQSFSYEPTPSNAEAAKQESEATKAQAEQQPTVRRSYSYEPQSQPTTQWRGSGRRFGGGRDRWLFQKADPHRID